MGPDFPESWKPLSNAHGKGLKALRESKDLNWAYLSPACNFVADGVRTGKYKLGGKELTLSSNDKKILEIVLLDMQRFTSEISWDILRLLINSSYILLSLSVNSLLERFCYQFCLMFFQTNMMISFKNIKWRPAKDAILERYLYSHCS